MDGVLWRGNVPIQGLQGFFSWLRQRGVSFVLVTNNASRTGLQYVQRLADYGVEIAPDQVITSAQATAGYLAEQSKHGTSVYVIGEDGLRQALAAAGFHLTDANTRPTYVVVGWDRNLTFEKLAQASLHIRAGATFVATNADRTWPSERGLLPGAGAILAAIQTATDVEPIVIGKPWPLMLELAMRRIGGSPRTTAMIGDRLETDILGGKNAGLNTILVLSGVAMAADLTASPVQPDLVFDDINALVHAWQARITLSTGSRTRPL
jgi:4-nitrophenyl phosphatase